MFTVFNFAASANKEYKVDFQDVESDSWYYRPVMELSDRGIINGYGDGTFGSESYITRAEVAKLLYEVDVDMQDWVDSVEKRLNALDGGISFHDRTYAGREDESEIEDNSNEEEVEVSDDSEGSVFDTTGDDEQLVLNINVNLDSAKVMPDGYALFEELSNQNFQVYYPAILFWNNTLGGVEDNDAYVWKVAFGTQDFDGMDDSGIEDNNRMSVSVVKTDTFTSDRDVVIFVQRDLETSFAVEGDSDDLDVLQKMAVSLTKIANLV